MVSKTRPTATANVAARRDAQQEAGNQPHPLQARVDGIVARCNGDVKRATRAVIAALGSEAAGLING